MRPRTTSFLFRLDADPTLENFAQVAATAILTLHQRLGVPQSTLHMGQEDLVWDSPALLDALRADLVKHGKAILTVRWGEGMDEWESVCLIGGLGATMQPAIAALWLGQDSHEMIVRILSQADSDEKAPVLH